MLKPVHHQKEPPKKKQKRVVWKLKRSQTYTMEEPGPSAPSPLTSASALEHNSNNNTPMASPADRLKVNSSQQAQTPTTQASCTPTSVDTQDFTTANIRLSEDASSSSTARSNSNSSRSIVRLSLPSPSRSRLDHQYAKRLPLPPTSQATAAAAAATASASISTDFPAPSNGRGATTSSSTCSSSGLVPPPGITRDSGDFSIFRPVPAVTPETSMHPFHSSSSSLSSSRKYRFSLSRENNTTTNGISSSITNNSFVRRRTTAVGIGSRAATRATASDLGTSDRFIPSRATSNLNVNLWDSMSSNSNCNTDNRQRTSPGSSPSSPGGAGSGGSQGGPEDSSSGDSQGNTSTADGDSSNSNSNGRSQDNSNPYNQNIHNILLRSELLGENISPYASNFATATSGSIPRFSSGGIVTQPLRDGKNRLRFQSPRQAYQENVFNEVVGPTSVVNSFSLTPIGSAASQRLMAAPQKRRRRIAKVPFKVLDAPALQDDFYLNLVDWSSQNVLAVGLGSCVYLWSACTSKVTKLCDLAQTEDIVTSVSWAQRGTHLAVGTNRGEVQLWDTIKCKKVRTMAGHSARVGTLAWTGPYLASGSRDRLVFLRDVRVQAAFTDRLSAHKQEVCGLKWSYDEPAFLASGGNDNQLHVVDSRNTASPIHRFTDHTAAVKAIAWSPHQHGLLASGGGTADRCIRFWNTLSGSALNTVDTGSQVCNLAWSQNCNEIVSTHGYSLNQIVVWRYPSLSKVVTLTGHTYRVLYLAVSPDGSTIVTGAGDETLRFWQVFPGPRSDAKNNAGGLLFPNTLGSVIR